MSPQTGTAVLVLVVFVLPGFVALRYAEQTYRTRADDAGLERVLTALYFSLLSYIVIALLSWWLLDVDTGDVSELWRGNKPFGNYLALAGAATVVPLVIAEAARRWNASRVRDWMLRKAHVSSAHKTPSGWEHFFLQGRWAYVRATLKDGRVVGGFYGPSSFAGYTAETPDLYLETRYQLDDKAWFAGPAPGTLGLYIRADEIVSVEFYEAGAPEPRAAWWRRLLRWLTRTWGKVRDYGNQASSATDSQAGRNQPGGPGESGSASTAATSAE